jgi:hypothetical protein
MAYDATPYEVINLGNNRAVTLTELISGLELALGVEARIDRLPEQMGDVPQTFADIGIARRLLGYEPITRLEARSREGGQLGARATRHHRLKPFPRMWQDHLTRCLRATAAILMTPIAGVGSVLATRTTRIRHIRAAAENLVTAIRQRRDQPQP